MIDLQCGWGREKCLYPECLYTLCSAKACYNAAKMALSRSALEMLADDSLDIFFQERRFGFFGSTISVWCRWFSGGNVVQHGSSPENINVTSGKRNSTNSCLHRHTPVTWLQTRLVSVVCNPLRVVKLFVWDFVAAFELCIFAGQGGNQSMLNKITSTRNQLFYYFVVIGSKYRLIACYMYNRLICMKALYFIVRLVQAWLQ